MATQSRSYLDIVDRAGIWLGFVTTALCVGFTARYAQNPLLTIAAWWGPIIGLFAVVYAFMDLKARCKRYERILREHTLDPADEPWTFAD